MMRLRPIAGAPFGVEISGIDLASDLSDDLMRDLAETLYIHRVLVVRDQILDKSRYLRFGAALGTPVAHMPDPDRENRSEADAREGVPVWQTDRSWEAEPANLTLIYCTAASARGGETLVADQRGAAESLPADLRARVEGRSALHVQGAAGGRDGAHVAPGPGYAAPGPNRPAVRHPVLRRHPVTGTRSLYAMAGTPVGIDGYSPQEGAALLAELKRHATAPERVYHHLHLPGSILICDSCQTLHADMPVPSARGDESRRLLWRMSLRDLPRALNARKAA